MNISEYRTRTRPECPPGPAADRGVSRVSAASTHAPVIHLITAQCSCSLAVPAVSKLVCCISERRCARRFSGIYNLSLY